MTSNAALNTVTFTDTHCHLYFNDYDQDRPAVLQRAWEAGLTRILVPGIDLPTSQAALELAETHSRLFAAVGVHPNSSTAWDDSTLDVLENLAVHPKVVAIGEIGLDYYRQRAPRDHQKRVFREQLKLAEQMNLPVVVHTRNADPGDRSCIAETLETLAKFQVSGVLHSFSGNLSEAERTLDLGFFIGFTGPVTFKKAEALVEVVNQVPLDRLLIETDSPFLTPHPYRGKRNEPAFVQYVAGKISEIKQQPLEIVAGEMNSNARRLFKWRSD